MQICRAGSARVLTEEQQRILDETELDRRKIYFGAAGTGKTYLAMEKVRRLVAGGQKVLLTCFNRELGAYLRRDLAAELAEGKVAVTNFHDLLAKLLEAKGVPFTVPADPTERSRFFQDELVDKAYGLIAEMSEEEKYDALVIDEGQDFREDWFIVLQGLLREGEQGDFYIFADPYQSIFKTNAAYLAGIQVSKHRLTCNLRNSEAINNWLKELLPEAGLRSMQRGGMPVGFFPWQSGEEELRLVTKELGRLVSQRVRPERVAILSPHVMEKSAFAGREKIGEWPLVDAGIKQKEGKVVPSNAVRFYTIRSFKGLEADIVFLTGIRAGSQACTPGDVYVGSSRARFLLYLFYEEDYRFGGGKDER